MPLIDVTYDGKVGEKVLRRLGELLPDVVGEAVECPEEPSTGPVEPGDIEIRFRKKSPLDVGDLDVVIEARTKLFEHRVQMVGRPGFPNRFLLEVGRREEALALNQEAVTTYRTLAEANPDVYLPDLARALTNLRETDWPRQVATTTWPRWKRNLPQFWSEWAARKTTVDREPAPLARI